jgi:hypothetical protein
VALMCQSRASGIGGQKHRYANSSKHCLQEGNGQ